MLHFNKRKKNTIRKTNSNGHESAEYQVNKGKE